MTRKVKSPKKAGKNKASQNSNALYATERNAIWHDYTGYDGFSPSFQWTTKSDTVYGIVSNSPYDPPNQSPDKIFGQVSPSLPATMNIPFSQQWEYEFSPNRIIKTMGGNDSDAAHGDGIFREIITGSFVYKNGLLSGSVDGDMRADFENGQEVISFFKSNVPLAFSGFRGLGRITASKTNPASGFAKVAGYNSTPPPDTSWISKGWWDPSDRSIVEANGFVSLLPSGWWNDPFSPNLV